MDGFTACFEGLDDPRTGNAGRHDLLEMLMIALCTVLSGGEDCTDMAEFARVKLGFLRGFLRLEHGAPSHDTFSRLFRLLDPEQFRHCFQQFMARFAETCQGVVAIDGKVLRRSRGHRQTGHGPSPPLRRAVSSSGSNSITHPSTAVGFMAEAELSVLSRQRLKSADPQQAGADRGQRLVASTSASAHPSSCGWLDLNTAYREEG